MKAVAQGLCSGHYEKARRLGLIEMKGTGAKGGRPKGPKPASPLGQGWPEDPEPSVAELRALVKKLAKRVLLDPGAGQQERVAFARIAVSLDDDGVNKELEDSFRKMLGEARGPESGHR